MFIGLIISVSFWIPQLVNRPQLKLQLGPHYRIVYFAYIANGPFLTLLGLVLFFK